MWECPKCETLNEGAFCVVCDEAEPVGEDMGGYVADGFGGHGGIYDGGTSDKKNSFGKILFVLVLIIAVLIIGIMAASEIAQASDVNVVNEEYTTIVNDKYDYSETLDLDFSNQEFF